MPRPSEALPYACEAAEGSVASAVANKAHDTTPSMSIREGRLFIGHPW